MTRPAEMRELVRAAIAEKFAPAIDFRAPYAKVMLDMAADAALAAIEASGTHRLIPIADYRRLLGASEADDTIVRCEVCGAWFDQDDPARATADDFTGCWKMATGREEDAHLCRSYRALDPEPTAARPRDVAPTEQSDG